MRVALVGCRGLLGDIIGKAISDDPDIEVVTDLASSEVEDRGIPSVDADLVLWNDADESRLLRCLKEAAGRGPRILATLGDGRDASLWELTPQRTNLGALSPESLLGAIHDSTAGESA